MGYIQFSLLHIPAHVIVGNSLSNEVREHWFTPAHILGGWGARLASQERLVEQPPRFFTETTPERTTHDK
ncbi:hypothetical protein ABTD02_18645, partial [Acinetobacter baumannii]